MSASIDLVPSATPAIWRTVSRVKPEQVSKVTRWMPTLRPFGQGSTNGEAIDTRTRAIRRGRGHGTSADDGSGNRGRPARDGVRNPKVAAGRRSRRESDGVIVVAKPGNAGGAKGPDVWCAFEGGEVSVIGDEPDNAREDPQPRSVTFSSNCGSLESLNVLTKCGLRPAAAQIFCTLMWLMPTAAGRPVCMRGSMGWLSAALARRRVTKEVGRTACGESEPLGSSLAPKWNHATLQQGRFLRRP
jgi:hypothetical protein